MRMISLEEAGRLAAERSSANNGQPRVVTSGNFAAPNTLTRVVIDQLESCRLHTLLAQKDVPLHDGVTPESCFIGPGFRNHPRLSYVPARLSRVPRLFNHSLPPDIVLIHTTPERDGKVSLGVEVNIMPGAIEACRKRGGLVLAQVNPRMPYTFGDAEITLDMIDAAVEVDEPLLSTAPGVIDETSATIGATVAQHIGDGATLQAGIGAVPDAIIAGLTTRTGLRVWTEMFSDGVLALERHGVLDRAVPITSSFVFGSQDLYDWLHLNERVVMRRTETTNAVAEIAKQPQMTSVNTALQVDLFDQANASRINARIYSGFGGQTDFTVGALQSVGGKSFMALRSWHPKADVSTIVPLVSEPVTSFQHSSVVTEQGIAKIRGCDERTQARHIIEQCAHPSVRDELWEEAADMGLA
ncbi:MAG: acetyl-CoA hydrolase [Micrococcales bacterium]|nr:acetyl-CoA hydrolase [Micrococcales bacterium]